ncbi:MAG: hypothetical protein IT371_21720 [Deltaproteobacteria bacterium]|nr:hypothetical protein [Deltaproteobacteria bacterium]
MPLGMLLWASPAMARRGGGGAPQDVRAASVTGVGKGRILDGSRFVAVGTRPGQPGIDLMKARPPANQVHLAMVAGELRLQGPIASVEHVQIVNRRAAGKPGQAGPLPAVLQADKITFADGQTLLAIDGRSGRSYYRAGGREGTQLEWLGTEHVDAKTRTHNLSMHGASARLGGVSAWEVTGGRDRFLAPRAKAIFGSWNLGRFVKLSSVVERALQSFGGATGLKVEERPGSQTVAFTGRRASYTITTEQLGPAGLLGQRLTVVERGTNGYGEKAQPFTKTRIITVKPLSLQPPKVEVLNE